MKSTICDQENKNLYSYKSKQFYAVQFIDIAKIFLRCQLS